MKNTSKIHLFLDADDTILCSSEAVVEILNKKYGKNVDANDIHQWNYTCCFPETDESEINQIFESDEFWKLVKLNPIATKWLKKQKHNMVVHIVSKGTPVNLEKKKKFFHKHLPKACFVGLGFGQCGAPYDKSAVNMRPLGALSVQIDDRTDCLLKTNATLKVLLTHGVPRPWNRYSGGEDNLYLAKSWNEIIDIVDFYLKNRKLLLGVSCRA